MNQAIQRILQQARDAEAEEDALRGLPSWNRLEKDARDQVIATYRSQGWGAAAELSRTLAEEARKRIDRAVRTFSVLQEKAKFARYKREK